MAKENNWGYKRIVGELKKLSIRVSRSSIQNILHENQFEPTPLRLDPTWKKFIEMHMNTLIACDFFTKPMWTLRGRVDIYVLFFIELGSCRVHIAGMSPHPNQCWVEQRTVETISKMHESGFYPKYLIRDRDGKYSKRMDMALESLGVKTVKTPPRSPVCNVFRNALCGQ